MNTQSTIEWIYLHFVKTLSLGSISGRCISWHFWIFYSNLSRFVRNSATAAITWNKKFVLKYVWTFETNDQWNSKKLEAEGETCLSSEIWQRVHLVSSQSSVFALTILLWYVPQAFVGRIWPDHLTTRCI